jgi:hypothetical protein
MRLTKTRRQKIKTADDADDADETGLRRTCPSAVIRVIRGELSVFCLSVSYEHVGNLLHDGVRPFDGAKGDAARSLTIRD